MDSATHTENNPTGIWPDFPLLGLSPICYNIHVLLDLEDTHKGGRKRIREHAQKQMMQQIVIQITVSLFSFWFTWVFALMHAIYQILTGKILTMSFSFLQIVWMPCRDLYSQWSISHCRD